MLSKRPSAFDVLMSKASKKSKEAYRTCEAPAETLQTFSSNPNSNSVRELAVNPAEKEQQAFKKSNSEKLPDRARYGSILIEGQTKVSTLARKDSKIGDSKNKIVVAGPDESVVELKKKGSCFNVRKAVYWLEGQKVPFMFVVKAFDAIAKESGRIAITEIVCNMLRAVIETSPDDLLAIVYFLANRVAPAHQGLELGIGDALIIKALAEAYGTKEANIQKQSKELGDLGLVAKASRSSQPLMRKPEPLTVVKVFDTFQLIAKESGRDCQVKIKNHIKALLVAATDCEPQYLIRLLQRKLRIDLAEQTLLTALGHAAVYSENHSSPPKEVDNPLAEAAKVVKQVYSVIPVYDKIVPALLSGGVWNLPTTCRFLSCTEG